MSVVKTRVIPVLLLMGKGLVKTTKFRRPVYIGDPINSVRIFNEKEVDELVFLDIAASRENRGPDFGLLKDIASEAFMPMAYGGGIASLEQVQRVFELGFEKVVLNSAVYRTPELVGEAAAIFGSQSIVASIDVRRGFLGRYQLYTLSGGALQPIRLTDHCIRLEQLGVGEIIVNAIDRDGTQAGYDLRLLQAVSKAVRIPVVACGGASGIDDFERAVKVGGASAVAAGSFFVFVGPHRAVLITYPERDDLLGRLP